MNDPRKIPVIVGVAEFSDRGRDAFAAHDAACRGLRRETRWTRRAMAAAAQDGADSIRNRQGVASMRFGT
jgi:hypothetical protein